MSTTFYVFTLLSIGTILFCNVDSRKVLRNYVIRKDFFAGIKANEFSVYDQIEKNLHYRIESKYAVLANYKLVSYPSKQVVARLKSKLNLMTYKGELSLLDSETDEWIEGTIKQDFKLTLDIYHIRCGDYSLTMEKKMLSYSVQFYGANQSDLLAQFTLRPGSLFWTRKYDMQIFSDEYPEEIFLLGLVIRDQQFRRG